MTLVINVMKWLLWAVEIMHLEVVEPAFYIYNN